ncbi:MAG: hypothetical protein WDO70_09330 [Alphaproteobacteria bacterium]
MIWRRTSPGSAPCRFQLFQPVADKLAGRFHRAARMGGALDAIFESDIREARSTRGCISVSRLRSSPISRENITISAVPRKLFVPVILLPS